MSSGRGVFISQVTLIVAALTLAGCAQSLATRPQSLDPSFVVLPPPVYQLEQQQQPQQQWYAPYDLVYAIDIRCSAAGRDSCVQGSRAGPRLMGSSPGYTRRADERVAISRRSANYRRQTNVGRPDCRPDDLDCNEALQRLGAFRTPPEMWVDSEATLEFAVADTREAIVREFGDNASLSGLRNVFVGQCMRVTLEPDPAIRIQGSNGEIRRLARDRNRASWSWRIVPLIESDPILRAKVEVLAQVGGECPRPDSRARVLDQYTERVSVRISITGWKGFLRGLSEAKSLGELLKAVFASWEGVFVGLGSLVTAIGGAWLAIKALGKRRRRRGQKSRSAPAAPAAADSSEATTIGQ